MKKMYIIFAILCILVIKAYSDEPIPDHSFLVKNISVSGTLDSGNYVQVKFEIESLRDSTSISYSMNGNGVGNGNILKLNDSTAAPFHYDNNTYLDSGLVKLDSVYIYIGDEGAERLDLDFATERHNDNEDIDIYRFVNFEIGYENVAIVDDQIYEVPVYVSYEEFISILRPTFHIKGRVKYYDKTSQEYRYINELRIYAIFGQYINKIN